MINIDFNKLNIKGTVVIGVSGGADSMALFHYMLNNYKDKLIVTNINHNVRKESKIEQEYIEDICIKNNIIFETMTIDNYNENNFENEARKKRYSFYEEILNKYGAKYLLLAHHADDLIETILMKITRGSNINGYAGIKKISKKKDYYIIRPLLDYTKEEILEYIKENNIKYFEDYTNKDTTYTRNRFRINLLPLLKKEDKDIHKKFIKYSNTLLEYNDYVNYEIENNLKEVYINNILYINKFNLLHPFLKKNILYHILNDLYDNKENIVKEIHIENILKIINNKKPNITINLPKDIHITKEYNIIKITKDIEIKDYKKEFKDNFYLDNHSIKTIDNIDTDGNDICRLNSEEISFPLYIRNKKEKDTIEVLGLNGTKKVKDIFIEKKLPTKVRNNYPLLVDNNDIILWIPNIKKSKFNKKKHEKYDIILKYCDQKEENK